MWCSTPTRSAPSDRSRRPRSPHRSRESRRTGVSVEPSPHHRSVTTTSSPSTTSTHSISRHTDPSRESKKRGGLKGQRCLGFVVAGVVRQGGWVSGVVPRGSRLRRCRVAGRCGDARDPTQDPSAAPGAVADPDFAVDTAGRIPAEPKRHQHAARAIQPDRSPTEPPGQPPTRKPGHDRPVQLATRLIRG